MNKTHVLVTGGAGFIGSELVRQLAAQRFRVTVVDSLVNGKRKNLEGVLGADFELVVAEVRDKSTMAPLLRVIDVIFHLACLGVRRSTQGKPAGLLEQEVVRNWEPRSVPSHA